MLNAARLFQALLTEAAPAGADVASDLDIDSFSLIPFVTHGSVIAQDRNGPGLWSVTLTVNVFLEPTGAHDVVADLYHAIHAWGEDPDVGIVPGVGAIEEVEDANAFTAVSGEVQMLNKVVRQYQAIFTITART